MSDVHHEPPIDADPVDDLPAWAQGVIFATVYVGPFLLMAATSWVCQGVGGLP